VQSSHFIMSADQYYQVLRAFGHEAHVIVSSAQTGGTSCIIRMFAPPGKDVPLHTHHFEDEIFVVESGISFGNGGMSLERGINPSCVVELMLPSLGSPKNLASVK
jgi:hypothetical protein